METYETIVTTLALTLGVSWASGINLYAALVMLGVAGHTGNLVLPPDLMVLQDPMVIAAAGLMYCVEFFADKAPGVDTGWDAIHTFIRIPAGAILASGAVGEIGVPMELAAAIVGGSLAATSHATKASARMLINTSPEPASNWLASLSEDVITIGGLWLALNHPVLFMCFLVLFLALVVWLLPKIWRLLGAVIGKIRGWFGRSVTQVAGEDRSASRVSDVTAQDSTEPTAQARALPGEETVAALERLAALRAAGDLSDAEFEQAKARLLQQ